VHPSSCSMMTFATLALTAEPVHGFTAMFTVSLPQSAVVVPPSLPAVPPSLLPPSSTSLHAAASTASSTVRMVSDHHLGRCVMVPPFELELRLGRTYVEIVIRGLAGERARARPRAQPTGPDRSTRRGWSHPHRLRDPVDHQREEHDADP